MNEVYFNFWGKPRREYTEMEVALMEGGHSIEPEKEDKFTFLKTLTENKNESN